MSADLIAAVYQTNPPFVSVGTAARRSVRMNNHKLRCYDGDDAIQDAAIDAWLYDAEIRTTTAQAARALVRHTYLAALARESRIKRGGGQVSRLVDKDNNQLDVASYARSPLADLCDAEDARELWDVVATLPGRQGEAVALRYRADLTVAETAAQMGLSIEAVGGLLKRGLKALRDRMAS